MDSVLKIRLHTRDTLDTSVSPGRTVKEDVNMYDMYVVICRAGRFGGGGVWGGSGVERGRGAAGGGGGL